MAMLTAIPYVASSLGDAGIHALGRQRRPAVVNRSGIPFVRAIFMLTVFLSLISSHLI
jgi:hypothetical protein